MNPRSRSSPSVFHNDLSCSTKNNVLTLQAQQEPRLVPNALSAPTFRPGSPVTLDVSSKTKHPKRTPEKGIFGPSPWTARPWTAPAASAHQGSWTSRGRQEERRRAGERVGEPLAGHSDRVTGLGQPRTVTILFCHSGITKRPASPK